MSVASSITTAEQLLARASELGRCELVRGELIMMSPAGFRHGRIAAKLAHLLLGHVEKHHLGVILGAETGFILARNPDTVRAPDVAFVKAQRAKEAPQRGFFPAAPDLAVEVLSPDDSAGEVLAKVRDWLAAGTIAVWIVDPEHQTVAVHQADGPVVTYEASDELPGADPLPDFQVKVKAIFE